MSTSTRVVAGEEVSQPSAGAEGGFVPTLQRDFGAMASALGRLADLQVAIWLADLKRTVLRIVLATGLSLVALVFGILTVLFLYAWAFRMLTDVLKVPTVWALLLFAGGHALMAGILAVAVVAILNRGEKRTRNTGGDK